MTRSSAAEVPNHLPLGPIVDPLPSGRPPARLPMEGRYVRLEPLIDASATAALHGPANAPEIREALWAYMSYGPFADLAAFATWMESCAASAVDPIWYLVIDRADGRPKGMVSYLNIRPAQGVIEVGHIWYLPETQKTRLPTEAMALMFAHAIDELGYRRMEWKCNDLNEGSKRAALRLGFKSEGVFRQHMIVKGRNRDTAWFAFTDADWRASLRAAYERWLRPENFDERGRQRERLNTP